MGAPADPGSSCRVSAQPAPGCPPGEQPHAHIAPSGTAAGVPRSARSTQSTRSARYGTLQLRITEPLRLETTPKIIKSNRHPNTPTPAKPCPQVPHPHGF